MDFLSTVPVLRFFLQKLELGKSQSYVIFFRCWWPPPRCREGGKSGNFFWSTFWLKWFFYFIVFVWLPWNSRPALQISWPVPSPGLSCPGQWPPRMCWTHPLDWWYNHQVDNAWCLKVEWEKFFGFRLCCKFFWINQWTFLFVKRVIFTLGFPVFQNWFVRTLIFQNWIRPMS